MTAQQPARPQDSAQFDSNAVKSTLYGGLNTSSSALSIPNEDTPDLNNIYISDTGNIRCRPGTRFMSRVDTSHPRGVMCVPYVSRTGKKLLIYKEGTSLRIAQRTEHEYSDICIKTGVFPESAANLKPDFIITNEPIARIIFTTSVSAPVQLTIVESSDVVSIASARDTITVEGLDQLNLTSAAFTNNDAVLYIDGERRSVVSHSGNDITLDTQLEAGTYVADVLKVTWQWWTAGIALKGNMLVNTNQRYHATVADASIAIPPEVLVGIEEVSNGNYPIRVYQGGKTSAEYDFVPFTPSTKDEWAFSYGITYESGDYITPGISHITFGDADTVSDGIETLYFMRGYKLFGGAWTPNDLYVEVAGEQWFNYSSASAPRRYALRESGTYARNTTSGSYITLEGVDDINVPSLGDVYIVAKRLLGTGASASTTVNMSTLLLNDGSPYPVFGLHEHCDYANGVFPRAISIYANRIVLAGFPNNPMKVVLSNILDGIIPGRYYSNFQTVLDVGRSDAAINLSVSTDSTRGQPIVAVAEFADNLFVFTPVSSVRVRGSGTGNITAADATIISLGAIGAFNTACVVKAEGRLLFFGPQGLYAIIPVAEIGGFRTEELSLKIRDLLSNTKEATYNDLVAWIDYSPANNRAVLAVSDTRNKVTASKLYMYNFTYRAWSTYSFLSGVIPTYYGAYVEESANVDKLLLLGSNYFYEDSYSLPTPVTFLIQDEILPIDYTRRAVGNGAFNTYDTEIEVLRVTHVTTRLIRKYNTTIDTTGQQGGFVMNPDPNVEDVSITLDGVPVPFKDGFYKVDAHTIYLQYPMNDGQTLDISYSHIDEQGNVVYPVEVLVDNVPQEQNVDYTVEALGNTYSLYFPEPIESEAVLKVGLHTLTYWTTPIFIRQTLFSAKRLKDVAVLMRNHNEVWTELDANKLSNQPLDALLGRYVLQAQLNVSVSIEGRYSNFYGDTRLRWDDAMFDVDSSYGQSADVQALSVPLLGRVKQFQLRFWSMGAYVWEMVGYQINAVVSNSDRRRNRRGM